MYTMMMRSAAALGLAAALVAGSGCRYDDRRADDRRAATAVTPYQDVNLRVDSSRREALVGEVVTFTARTENLFGRNANIEWSAPAGDLRTQQEGRVARVIFDQPGTYSVTATLFIDEFEVRRDTQTVTINPLR
jgi:hypothetical protein